jgi:hypothetical protein
MIYCSEILEDWSNLLFFSPLIHKAKFSKSLISSSILKFVLQTMSSTVIRFYFTLPTKNP